MQIADLKKKRVRKVVILKRNDLLYGIWMNNLLQKKIIFMDWKIGNKFHEQDNHKKKSEKILFEK